MVGKCVRLQAMCGFVATAELADDTSLVSGTECSEAKGGQVWKGSAR